MCARKTHLQVIFVPSSHQANSTDTLELHYIVNNNRYTLWLPMFKLNMFIKKFSGYVWIRTNAGFDKDQLAISQIHNRTILCIDF